MAIRPTSLKMERKTQNQINSSKSKSACRPNWWVLPSFFLFDFTCRPYIQNKGMLLVKWNEGILLVKWMVSLETIHLNGYKNMFTHEHATLVLHLIPNNKLRFTKMLLKFEDLSPLLGNMTLIKCQGLFEPHCIGFNSVSDPF